MTVAVQAVSPLPRVDIESKTMTSNLTSSPGNDEIVTVTDLFLSKVRDTPDTIFVQYPATLKGKSDYIGYTVTDIDRLVDEAARQYANKGLQSEVRFQPTF